MKYLLIILLFAFGWININAQVLLESKAKIDNIDFDLVDSVVLIKYDLVNAKEQERFDIIVYIYKASDNQKVEAMTFSGDLFNQQPGKGKAITWDITKDVTYLDDNIYILLEAKHLNPVTIPYSSKKKAYLQSTAFPGWGTSTISMNKVHLVKGVMSYSLVALSIKANYDAVKHYDNYLASNISTERDKLFKQAESSYNSSFYYFGGAAAIWLGEYLWLYLAPNKTDALEMSKKKLSFTPVYDSNTLTPMLSLTYNF